MIAYFRSLRDVPPSYNLAEKPYQSDGDPYEQIYFRSSQNNPYWVVNHNYRNTKTPRTIGNLLLEYELAEGAAERDPPARRGPRHLGESGGVL